MNQEQIAIIEDYIRQLPWSPQATDDEKTLIAGNIRAFSVWLFRGDAVLTYQSPTALVETPGAELLKGERSLKCSAVYELATSGRALCDRPCGHTDEHTDSAYPISWPRGATEQDYDTGQPLPVSYRHQPNIVGPAFLGTWTQRVRGELRINVEPSVVRRLVLDIYEQADRDVFELLEGRVPACE